MAALIGVTSVWSLETKGEDRENPGGYFYNPADYSNALFYSGGLPVLITPPVVKDSNQEIQAIVESILNGLSGLYLSGGGGTKRFKAPEMPGLEEQQPSRYRFEKMLIAEAWKRKMPVIGSCRGHQMIIEVLGGKIKPETINGHQQKNEDKLAHEINITPGSQLEQLTGLQNWKVNSMHCQVAEKAPPGFLVSAISPEGYIEAVEAENSAFWLGFQFHPEIMYSFDPHARKIINAFSKAVKNYHKKS